MEVIEDLNRYLYMQDQIAYDGETDIHHTYYNLALSELMAGRKESHWMWFIFPQIKGLGFSKMDATYSIKSLEEAQKYLKHPILGKRIRNCSQLLLDIDTDDPEYVMGYPDDLKLRSSMTLFDIAFDGENNVFGKVIDKYYDGERDGLTVEILYSIKDDNVAKYKKYD